MLARLLFITACMVSVCLLSGSQIQRVQVDGGDQTRTIQYLDEDFVLTCYCNPRPCNYHQLKWKKDGYVPSCRGRPRPGNVCMTLFIRSNLRARLHFGIINSDSEGIYTCERSVSPGQITGNQSIFVRVSVRNSTPPVFVYPVKRNNTSMRSNAYIAFPCVFKSLNDEIVLDMNISVTWKNESNAQLPEQVRNESYGRVSYQVRGQNASILYYPANAETVPDEMSLYSCAVSSPYYNKTVTKTIELPMLKTFSGGGDNKNSKSILLGTSEPTLVTKQHSVTTAYSSDGLVMVSSEQTQKRMFTESVTEQHSVTVVYSSDNTVMSTMFSEQTTNDSTMVIASMSVAGCLVLVLVAVLSYYCKRTSLPGTWDGPQRRLSIKQRQIAQRLQWLQQETVDIRVEQIKFEKVVGNGFFGVVYKATVSGLIGQEAMTKVAVKMANDETTSDASNCLVDEAVLLTKFGGHEHVVSLLGVCLQRSLLWLVMEYAEHGSLRGHLRSQRLDSSSDKMNSGDVLATDRQISCSDVSLSTSVVLHYALQVASGMAHLISQKCIHRDLAARNVLVFAGEKLKISDFGLAKDVHYQEYYRKTSTGMLPVKWTAPEALLHKVYSEASDVWSFGVVLWEIVTRGGTPYPGVDAGTLFHLLAATPPYRMARPRGCSSAVYNLMVYCWKSHPSDRPTFSTLVADISKLMFEQVVDEGLP